MLVLAPRESQLEWAERSSGDVRGSPGERGPTKEGVSQPYEGHEGLGTTGGSKRR